MENVVNKRFIEVKNKLNVNNSHLARKLKVSHTTVNKIVYGDIGVSEKIALKIKEAFGVNPDWLLYGKGEMFLEDSKKENKDIKDVKEKLTEFKGFLKALLQLEHQEKLWEKIEPNFPKCKQAV